MSKLKLKSILLTLCFSCLVGMNACAQDEENEEQEAIVALLPVEGDNTDHIQNAIDDTEAPGTVLLLPGGVYEVSGVIRLDNDGVVLRTVVDPEFPDDPDKSTVLVDENDEPVETEDVTDNPEAYQEMTVYYFEEVEETPEEETEEKDLTVDFRNAAQFVRLFIPGGQANFTFAEVYEIKVFESGSNQNIALNALVTASSTRPGYCAGNVVNGSLVGKWSSAGNSGAAEWLTIDLGSVFDVARIDVIKSRMNFPREFEIQTSTDGNTWTPITVSSKKPLRKWK